MIFGNWSDRILKPATSRLVRDEAILRWRGRRLMQRSKAYNHPRYGERRKRHLRAYQRRWEELLRSNNEGILSPQRLSLKDGWARDNSGSLPHLDALLDQAEEIIRERGGRRHSDVQQPYLRSLLFPENMQKCPEFLDFILSSEVLDIAARHLGTAPVLSRTRPPGVRFMESNAAQDPGAGGAFRQSQLYH